MTKWIKLPGNQYLGFWALGLLLFALQEIPYLAMPLFHLESNPIMNLPESSPALALWEKVLGSLCIVLMTFVVRGDAALFSVSGKQERLFFFLAAVVLLVNFFGWGLYFAGHQSRLVMLLFLVLLPPLYYILIGLWRGNPALVLTGSAFLAVHFTHVYCNT